MKIKTYIKSIFITLLVGGIVGLIMSKFIDYDQVIKPPFSPPSILFPIMWTILYILMGISYGRIKNKGLMTSESKTIYYTQLFVNAFWSIFFFVFKWRLFSFIWLLLLIGLIVVMIINFYKKDKVAAYLQLPYLLWCIFASYLNFGVYILNR